MKQTVGEIQKLKFHVCLLQILHTLNTVPAEHRAINFQHNVPLSYRMVTYLVRFFFKTATNKMLQDVKDHKSASGKQMMMKFVF